MSTPTRTASPTEVYPPNEIQNYSHEIESHNNSQVCNLSVSIRFALSKYAAIAPGAPVTEYVLVSGFTSHTKWEYYANI